MSKITLKKSYSPPFLKRGDLFYGDMEQIHLLHIDDTWNTTVRKLYNGDLTNMSDKVPHDFTGVYQKVLKPENIKWKPVEIDIHNKRLREELDDSHMIICEDEVIKEFITKILEVKKNIITL